MLSYLAWLALLPLYAALVLVVARVLAYKDQQTYCRMCGVQAATGDKFCYEHCGMVDGIAREQAMKEI